MQYRDINVIQLTNMGLCHKFRCVCVSTEEDLCTYSHVEIHPELLEPVTDRCPGPHSEHHLPGSHLPLAGDQMDHLSRNQVREWTVIPQHTPTLHKLTLHMWQYNTVTWD